MQLCADSPTKFDANGEKDKKLILFGHVSYGKFQQVWTNIPVMYTNRPANFHTQNNFCHEQEHNGNNTDSNSPGL
jgi:hypothetical protein